MDHARLMDRTYRIQRHFYDATRALLLTGRDRVLRAMAAAPGGEVIEVGCGTGRNLAELARLLPGARLHGLDASALMLRTARSRLRRAGLGNRVDLRQGLAEELDRRAFGLERPFDQMLFSYSLSMMPAPPEALERAWRDLAPGGRVWVVDFSDLAGLPGPVAGALRRWLGLFHVRTGAHLREALGGLARGKGAGLRVRELPGGYAFAGLVVKPPARARR